MKYNIENRSGLYINGVAYPDGLWSGGGYRAEYVDPVVNITRYPYDEIDTVIYDDSNIFIEFNELVGTSTDSNVLVATAYDGYGIADDVTGTDLIGLSNISAEFEFSNISDDASTADTLVTNSPIQDGDNLVIVKDDESIHELVAVVTGASVPIYDGTLNPSEDRHNPVTTGPVDISIVAPVDNNGWKGFNGVVTDWYSSPNTTRTLYLRYAFDEPVIITKAGVVYSEKTNWFSVEGSNDDVAWTELYKDYNVNSTTQYNWVGFYNATAYKYYRGRFSVLDTPQTDKIGWKIRDFIFVKHHSTPTLVDTSAVTQGEIPSEVYTVDAQPSFAIGGDYIDAVVESSSYSYTNAPPGDVIINGDFEGGISDWVLASGGVSVTTPTVAGQGKCGQFNSNHDAAHNRIDKTINVTANKTYDFSFKHKGTYNGESFTITLSDGNYGSTVLASTVPTTKATSFTTFSKQVTPTVDTLKMSIRGTWSANTYLDDIVMIEVSNEVFTSTKTYDILIDSVASSTISSKVLLKSIGDKMTKMKFTTIKENT